jgi:hypothetical protein
MENYATFRVARDTCLRDYIASIAQVTIDGETMHDPKHLDYMMKLVFYIAGYCGSLREVYEVATELDLGQFIHYCVWGHYRRGMKTTVPYLKEEEHQAVLRMLASEPVEMEIYKKHRMFYWM